MKNIFAVLYGGAILTTGVLTFALVVVLLINPPVVGAYNSGYPVPENPFPVHENPYPVPAETRVPEVTKGIFFQFRLDKPSSGGPDKEVPAPEIVTPEAVGDATAGAAVVATQAPEVMPLTGAPIVPLAEGAVVSLVGAVLFYMVWRRKRK